MIGVNHFGHFLLTDLLLPVLAKTGETIVLTIYLDESLLNDPNDNSLIQGRRNVHREWSICRLWRNGSSHPPRAYNFKTFKPRSHTMHGKGTLYLIVGCTMQIIWSCNNEITRSLPVLFMQIRSIETRKYFIHTRINHEVFFRRQECDISQRPSRRNPRDQTFEAFLFVCAVAIHLQSQHEICISYRIRHF